MWDRGCVLLRIGIPEQKSCSVKRSLQRLFNLDQFVNYDNKLQFYDTGHKIKINANLVIIELSYSRII